MADPQKTRFSEVVFDWSREAPRLSQAEKAEFHRKAIEKLNARYLKLQLRIQKQITEYHKADDNYIEQGIQLIEIVRNAYEFFQSKGKPERAELIRFILPDSKLHDIIVEPAFKLPFDIIWQLAQETRKYKPDIKKQAADELSAACPIMLHAQKTRTITILLLNATHACRRKNFIQ